MSPAANLIILESQNSRDLSQAALDQVKERIEAQLDALGSAGHTVIAVAHEPTGVGNHLSDFLNVFLPSADGLKDVVWEIVLSQVKALMLARFARPHERVRPRVIVFRDSETGEVQRVLQANRPGDDFVEVDAEIVDSRRPPSLRLRPTAPRG